MKYDKVRFLVVQDFLKYKKKGIWKEQPPSSLTAIKDRRFYLNLLRGMIRHQRLLDVEIYQRAKRPQKLQQVVQGILSLGVYQFFFMDKVPRHASIYETVALAVPFGVREKKGLINAVLRNLQRDLEASLDYLQKHPLFVRSSHQDWMARRWSRHYSEQAIYALCEANNLFEGSTIRPITPWTTSALQEGLLQEGIKIQPHPIVSSAFLVNNTYELLQSAVFQQGGCYVQDASSQVFLELAQKLWNGEVLDMCAAPGGKSLYILGSSKLQTLVCNDISIERLQLLRNNFQRLRQVSPKLTVSDGVQLPFGRVFDTILLDAPCSATGTIRKNPDVKWVASEQELLSKVPLQKKLLDQASRHIKPGGFLVYATCSIEPEENEQQIEGFLTRHPEFRLCSFSQISEIPSSYLSYVTQQGYYQVVTNSLMMGFFAAVLQHQNEVPQL